MKRVALGIWLLSMMICSASLYAQKKVTGKVTDIQNNEVLNGATVTVDGTNVSAFTDKDGTYIITVLSDTASLVFSYVGYTSQKVSVGERTLINVQLNLSSLAVENEVVVVGYGKQRKIDLTGAVESISAKTLTERPVISTSMALQGLAPGVTVTQSSGRPGADGGTIRIRGVGTLGNANPLILVDGRVGSLESVDANDIENMSVLKDAASASIYGSRAANGVILVTTKRGRKQPLKVRYNGYTGRQYFTNLPKYVDGYTHMVKNNEAVQNSGRTPVYSDQYIADWQKNNGLYSYEYPNVDWQKLMYSGNGLQEQHNINISGGNDNVTSFLSFTYRNQNGLLNNYKTQRIGVRSNTDYKVSDKIKLSFDLSARYSPITYPASGSDFVFDLVRYDPLFATYLPDGRYSTNDRNYPNLKAMVEQGGYNRTDYIGLSGRIMLELKPLNGLNINLAYMPDYNEGRGKLFSKPVALYAPGSDEPAMYSPSKSSLSETFSRDFTNNLNIVTTYNKRWSKHDFSILGGYEQVDYRTNNLSAYRENFLFLDYPVLNTGSLVNMTNGGTGSEWALRSFFGRLNYNFDDRYLFEANARYDGSSRFYRTGRFGFFPSFSVGWNINKESFLRNTWWIDELKIRGSWGKLGNQEIGNYPYTSAVSLGQNYVFGGVPATGGSLTELANEMISWETTASIDIGIDFTLFNKLSGSFDLYQKNTHDILLKLPIPLSTGLAAPYQNAGKVRNTGWDLSLGYRESAKPFKYAIRAILSDVKNEVVDLKGAGPFVSTYTIVKEGYPINALYMLRSDGLFQEQDEITNHAAQYGTLAPGDIRYINQLTIDSDGDGVPDKADNLINANDRVIVGSNIPRYTFSLDLSASYKGFDFSVFLQGVGKRDTYFGGSMAWAFYNRSQLHTWQLDYWTPENRDAVYPRLIDGSSGNNYQISDYWMYDASYIRIKSFQLGYTFPKSWSRALKADRIRIYCSGNNLLTFDKTPKGFDPEYPMGDTPVYPITGNYVFGVNLNF